MKPNNPLMLALALSTALFATACDRAADKTPAVDTAAAEQPMPAAEPAAEPAAMPAAEPAAAAPAAMAMPMDSGMSFADMDKNHDGSLAHDEIADTEMLRQHFDQADTDHDGKLSKAEVDKHRADMAAMPSS